MVWLKNMGNNLFVESTLHLLQCPSSSKNFAKMVGEKSNH